MMMDAMTTQCVVTMMDDDDPPPQNNEEEEEKPILSPLEINPYTTVINMPSSAAIKEERKQNRRQYHYRIPTIQSALYNRCVLMRKALALIDTINDGGTITRDMYQSLYDCWKAADGGRLNIFPTYFYTLLEDSTDDAAAYNDDETTVSKADIARNCQWILTDIIGTTAPITLKLPIVKTQPNKKSPDKK